MLERFVPKRMCCCKSLLKAVELEVDKMQINQKLLHATEARIEEKRDTVYVTLFFYIQNYQNVLKKSYNKPLP